MDPYKGFFYHGVGFSRLYDRLDTFDYLFFTIGDDGGDMLCGTAFSDMADQF